MQHLNNLKYFVVTNIIIYIQYIHINIKWNLALNYILGWLLSVFIFALKIIK